MKQKKVDFLMSCYLIFLHHHAYVCCCLLCKGRNFRPDCSVNILTTMELISATPHKPGDLRPLPEPVSTGHRTTKGARRTPASQNIMFSSCSRVALTTPYVSSSSSLSLVQNASKVHTRRFAHTEGIISLFLHIH